MIGSSWPFCCLDVVGFCLLGFLSQVSLGERCEFEPLLCSVLADFGRLPFSVSSSSIPLLSFFSFIWIDLLMSVIVVCVHASFVCVVVDLVVFCMVLVRDPATAAYVVPAVAACVASTSFLASGKEMLRVCLTLCTSFSVFHFVHSLEMLDDPLYSYGICKVLSMLRRRGHQCHNERKLL